jgi:hypothetical protein
MKKLIFIALIVSLGCKGRPLGSKESQKITPSPSQPSQPDPWEEIKKMNCPEIDKENARRAIERSLRTYLERKVPQLKVSKIFKGKVEKIQPKVWEARDPEDKPGEGAYYSCAIFEVELPILNSSKGELVKVLFPTEKVSEGIWVKEVGEEYLLFLVKTDDYNLFLDFDFPPSHYITTMFGAFSIKNNQHQKGGVPWWKCFAKGVLEYLASQ